MHFKLRLLLLLCIPFVATAQTSKNKGILNGKLLNKTSRQPAPDVQLTLPKLKLVTISDAEGKFRFNDVKFGSYQLVISAYNSSKNDTIKVTIDNNVTDIGIIDVSTIETGTAVSNLDIPTLIIDDGNVSTEDEGMGSQSVNSAITSSRDPFLNAISFVFGTYWFRPRNYDKNQQDLLINGAIMNDAENGDILRSQWGGLNDVFRDQTISYGLQASGYAYGGLTGSTYLDATAASQRKQTRVSYSLSNGIYRNRLMLTHSTGVMKNGWAYSISGSKRWSKEGYVSGTFYDAYSYYGAVSKIYKKHEFHLTAFGAPTRRGKASPATQEAIDLSGSHFYNPNWGYQDGEVRNSRVADNFQPSFIFNYEYKPSSKTRWNTAVSYQFGKNKSSTIDWYNSADPRPDYYRYLPSYNTIGSSPNIAAANAVAEHIQADPDHNFQVNWDRIYNVNYINTQTIYDVDGIAGNNVTGRRSLYVLGNYVENIKKFGFNTNIEHTVSDHITLYGGLSFTSQSTESYKEIGDLLGGEFFVDLNQFASRNLGGGLYTQNDLDHPNRIVKVGDKYNYDYITHFKKGMVWGQSTFNYNRFDLFVAANIGVTSYYREGLFRNALFANASLGNSDKQNYLTYNVKGGGTYKINGRNYLFVNGAIGSNAPDPFNTFVSLNIRNTIVPNLVNEKIKSVEGGYLMKAPRINVRVAGYATDITDATQRLRYYNNDPTFQSFTNFIMQGMNTRSIGTELAVNVKVTTTLDITAAASLGQSFYTNNPEVSVYNENDTITVSSDKHTVYLNNYSLSVGPQSAYTLGANYRSKDHWSASLSFNYMDRNYVEVAPDRRSEQAGDLVPKDSELWHKIFDQEELPSIFTVDLFAGYSWKLSKLNKKLGDNTYLSFNIGVNNLLNNLNIVNLGFEQLRYDFTSNEPAKFATKYMYGYGRNFFATASLRF